MSKDKHGWETVGQAVKYIRDTFSLRLTAKKKQGLKNALEYCADKDNITAQYLLYTMNQEGSGESKSDASLFWCQKSAENSYAPAQYDLAIHYLYGDGIEKDTYLAVVWMEKAACQGYQEACQKLVSLFNAGTLVRKNSERASYWSLVSEGVDIKGLPQLLDLAREDVLLSEVVADKAAVEDFDGKLSGVCDTIDREMAQNEVITASRDKSFIINAGPGTGKTYVLVHRINYLVARENLNPQNVVVLSFTKAVVKELAERFHVLSLDVENERGIRNVETRTFHSVAYELLSYANENMTEEGWDEVVLDFNKVSYEDCMYKGAELIRSFPDIVKGWEYFIVDEIQDINNDKAQFVIELLKACVEYKVPYMFLGDSCQAIYDYVNKKNTKGSVFTTKEFYEQVFELGKSSGAQFGYFDKNYRQGDDLQNLTIDMRKVILEEDKFMYKKVIDTVLHTLPAITEEELEEYILKNQEETICIMGRRNFTTKLWSNELYGKGIKHECVLDNHKGLLPRWIGEIFGGMNEDYLTEELLHERCKQVECQQYDANMIWDSIQEHTRDYSEVVNMKRVIPLLKMHELDDFDVKPIKSNCTVSNIHRSKGLEYEVVFLDRNYLAGASNSDEEMRTLYVALTRPKSKCYLVDRKKQKEPYKTGVNRERLKENGRIMYVDVHPIEEMRDYTQKSFLVDKMSVAQREIQRLNKGDEISIILDESQKRYLIVSNGVTIGVMSYQFYKEISQIYFNKEMPIGFENIRIDGVFTYIENEKDYYEGYGKYNIWNYVTFSGPIKAIY